MFKGQRFLFWRVKPLSLTGYASTNILNGMQSAGLATGSFQISGCQASVLRCTGSEMRTVRALMTPRVLEAEQVSFIITSGIVGFFGHLTLHLSLSAGLVKWWVSCWHLTLPGFSTCSGHSNLPALPSCKCDVSLDLPSSLHNEQQEILQAVCPSQGRLSKHAELGQKGTSKPKKG